MYVVQLVVDFVAALADVENQRFAVLGFRCTCGQRGVGEQAQCLAQVALANQALVCLRSAYAPDPARHGARQTDPCCRKASADGKNACQRIDALGNRQHLSNPACRRSRRRQIAADKTRRAPVRLPPCSAVRRDSRSSGPSRPAVRETRRPCASADRTCDNAAARVASAGIDADAIGDHARQFGDTYASCPTRCLVAAGT